MGRGEIEPCRPMLFFLVVIVFLYIRQHDKVRIKFFLNGQKPYNLTPEPLKKNFNDDVRVLKTHNIPEPYQHNRQHLKDNNLRSLTDLVPNKNLLIMFAAKHDFPLSL